MTLGSEARIMLVASVALCAPMVGARAQDDAVSMNGSDAAADEAQPVASEKGEAGGFWGWLNDNIEYPDANSSNNQRPRPGGGGNGGGGTGGGGDSGSGGGHGS